MYGKLNHFAVRQRLTRGEGNGKTHPSVPAQRTPGTEEPGGLLAVGSHRVGHDWSDLAVAVAAEASTTL